jgi:hypothetical protein
MLFVSYLTNIHKNKFFDNFKKIIFFQNLKIQFVNKFQLKVRK